MRKPAESGPPKNVERDMDFIEYNSWFFFITKSDNKTTNYQELKVLLTISYQVIILKRKS